MAGSSLAPIRTPSGFPPPPSHRCSAAVAKEQMGHRAELSQQWTQPLRENQASCKPTQAPLLRWEMRWACRGQRGWLAGEERDDQKQMVGYPSS